MIRSGRVSIPPRRFLFPAWLSACVLALPACAYPLTPCAAQACETGYECLANRCVAGGVDPVPPGASRVVFEPVAFAVAGNRSANAASATLGKGGAGASTLYLRFPNAWKRYGVVTAAFLLLSPSGGTEPGAEDVPLEVSPVGNSWSVERVSEGLLPSLATPHAAGLARGSPRMLVRVDVTRVAQTLASTPWDDGVAITAASTRGPGVSLATGGGAGDAPRLELYLARSAGPH
jgi:hypothetical protein